MSNYSTNEFKSGLKILIGNDPFVMLENEFVKPGKGQAFNRVKLRNLKNGRVIEKTYKSGESVKAADVVDVEMEYLYNDGHEWHFMNPSNYEQLAANIVVLAGAEKWLKESDVCLVTLWDGVPLSVMPPKFVELKVVETDPGVKGDTVSGATKPATLETNAVVRVPLFVDEGDVIKVDTRTGEYDSRVKS